MNTDDKHRAAALHLMRVLVEAGAQPDEPMANARITELAISVGLEDERLPALEYAGHQGWLDSEGEARLDEDHCRRDSCGEGKQIAHVGLSNRQTLIVKAIEIVKE